METLSKKERWIHALKRKLEMRTLEEWDWETMSEVIYIDDTLEFYRECQDDFVLHDAEGRRPGVESDLDYFLDENLDLGETIQNDALRGMSFLDYMETKGFPIAFKTWPDDTPWEWEPENYGEL